MGSTWWGRFNDWRAGVEGQPLADAAPEVQASVSDLRQQTRTAIEQNKRIIMPDLTVQRLKDVLELPSAERKAAARKLAEADFERLVESVNSVEIRLAKTGEMGANARHVRHTDTGREYVVYGLETLADAPPAIQRAILAHELLHSLGLGEFTTIRVEARLGGPGNAASTNKFLQGQATIHRALLEGSLRRGIGRSYKKQLQNDHDVISTLDKAKLDLESARRMREVAEKMQTLISAGKSAEITDAWKLDQLRRSYADWDLELAEFNTLLDDAVRRGGSEPPEQILLQTLREHEASANKLVNDQRRKMGLQFKDPEAQ